MADSPSADGQAGYPEITDPLLRAAMWLGRTHHHDWGLLNEEARRGRARAIRSEMDPMIDALMHLRVEERMELVGMVPCFYLDEDDIECMTTEPTARPFAWQEAANG